jgi:hypothetical protein
MSEHHFGRKYAVLCILAAVLAMAAPAAAPAADRDRAAPVLDPNAELSDAKLSPAVAKVLAEGVTLYDSNDSNGAIAKLTEARGLSGRTAYDDFQIENLASLVATQMKDFAGAAAAFEAMAASPALADSNRKAVYDGGMAFNAAMKRYWRAIQYGELLSRENLLDAHSTELLADIYVLDGSYADAERIAQAGIDGGAMSDKSRKKLQKLVADCQVKEGKVAATLSVGDDLLNAFAQGLVAGTTGQAVPPPIQQPTADQQASAAQAAEQQAQQQAAAEVLAADPAFERVVYADLFDRDTRISTADKKRAEEIFKAAYAAGQKQDYAAAESGFRSGLDVDPTNAEANYWYAYCLGHGGSDTLQALDYLARAAAFGGADDSGAMAQSALRELESPASSSQN